MVTAAAHFESFEKLTREEYWEDEGGRLLQLLACEQLTRVYMKMAERLLEMDEDAAFAYLLKAYDKAREGNSAEHELSAMC